VIFFRGEEQIAGVAYVTMHITKCILC